MNVNRLLILGMLSGWGPMYGHQIRRTAQLSNAEAWSEAKVGSFYSALNRMRDEELIEAVRTEREGNLPQRTVYKITAEGRREFRVLLDRGLRELKFGEADPFDVALAVAFDVRREELETVVRQRLGALSMRRDELIEKRERLVAEEFLPAVGLAIFRHRERRVEAELRWHEELLELLPTIAAEASDPQKRSGGAPGRAPGDRADSDPRGVGGAPRAGRAGEGTTDEGPFGRRASRNTPRHQNRP